MLFQALALSNDASRDNRDDPVGDPTEIALLVAAGNAGYVKSELDERLPRVGEIPFDSERKCMTTLHREADSVVAFVKCAPENILAAAHIASSDAGPLPLD